MALSSRTTGNAANSYDRLSDLCDSLIHHIISLLGQNDIVSLSSLSTRLRMVCLSCPYLSLSSNCESERPYYPRTRMGPSGTSSSGSDTDVDSISISSLQGASKYKNKGKDISWKCTEKCRLFTGFVDRFLNSNNGKEINSFSLHWSFKEVDDSHKGSIDGWIRKVAKCNLQELDLNLGGPSCNSHTFLGLPFESFSSLKNLSLEHVRITNVSLGNWVYKYCKSLKKLTLKHVHGIEKLSIKSSCLEDLTIYKGDVCHLKISTKKLRLLYIKLRFYSQEENLIKIYAPCLQSLTRIGTSVRYMYRGGFRSLQSGTINLEGPRYSKDTYLVHFLQSVCWARVLHLNFGVIKTLSKQSQLPILFENVHHLVLECSQSSGYEIPVITSFLEGLPCLNTLTIKYAMKSNDYWSHESDNNSEEFEDSQNSVVSRLKEVEIELCSWGFGKSLVKYLLKHANELEKMTVFYPRNAFQEMSSLDLQNLERASSTIGIFVLMKDFREDPEEY